MSGVFGIVDINRNGNLSHLTDQMGQKMYHRPWYVVESYVDEANQFALGRIGIGIFNPDLQPVWNVNRTIALVMAGEIYETTAANFQKDLSVEKSALQLYETYGDEFAQKLNGAFIIAIWDNPSQKLVITNDRFGFYRLFYTFTNGLLLFSPEMKGILCHPYFKRKIDLVALAQYMRFQHLLGTRTFFEDIHLLPGGSVLSFVTQAGSLQVKPYWTFEQIPYRPKITFEEAAEEAGRLLRRAVTRLSGDHHHPGIFLSGGLDGRTILGLVSRRPVVTLTFGAKDCRDVIYSQKIAKVMRSDHHWVEFTDGNWILENLDFHLDLTEGYHSWIHMHGISALPLARKVMDLNLSGWDGGTVMGHPESIDPLQYDPCSEEAFLTHQYHLFTQQTTWPGLVEGEERLLYTDCVSKKILGLAFDSFRDELAHYQSFRREVRHEYFYLVQHCNRFTQNMVIMGRSYIEQRFPFFDYDLIDFLYSLPVLLRADRMLYRAVIQNETPKLAFIPYNFDELPPTTHKTIRGLAFWKKRMQKAANRYLVPIFPEYQTLYADYESYLRNELRSWAEGILNDPLVVEHGIFRPSFLNTLMSRHVSGRELWTIGKIAPILTYEMMLRRFYD